MKSNPHFSKYNY